MTHPEDLPRTSQDYLKVVWNAYEWSEEPVTVTTIAERLGVRKSTASDTVKRLAGEQLLTHDPYRPVQLTERGRKYAVSMVRTHRLLETFLVQELGYQWDEVHEEAEILEHACSARMIEAIATRLGDPIADPHGDPIPRADGTVIRPPARPATEAPPGMWTVARVSDRDSDVLRGLAHLDVRPGRSVCINEDGTCATEEGIVIEQKWVEALWVVPPA